MQKKIATTPKGDISEEENSFFLCMRKCCVRSGLCFIGIYLFVSQANIIFKGSAQGRAVELSWTGDLCVIRDSCSALS